MAKRTNPFIDDFIQQSKVHVGIKQFNNNEERLQKVYEKTLQLLFNGARKSSIQDSSLPDDVTLLKKDGMKQLCIGKDGALLHTSVYVPGKDCLAKRCNCKSVPDSQCSYCEIMLCELCTHNCLQCKGVYCMKCMFDGSDGEQMCVSCYGQF